MDEKQTKKNLLFFPLGTIGRDMLYALFTNFILLYILYTKNLTTAQLAAVTAIMVAARIFDGLNDPIMGNLIERTRTRWGKYKPWLLAGVLSTSIVVYLAFNTDLTGWNFIAFFGVIYFMYSITFTMSDISYWGMIPALSSDGDTRNRFTSKTTLFAGIGSTLVSILVPLLTTGEFAIGGSAKVAYGRMALVIAVFAPICILFTLFGAKERRDDDNAPVPPVSFKKIISTITGNDQLMWICLAFVIQQLGSNIAIGGAGSNYIYFEFGYEGGLYSTYTTIGMLATAFLMVFYPAISRKLNRKPLMKLMIAISLVGYVIEIASGIFMPSSMLKFWIITIGFMLANFGQYGFYLVMMISIINTVEYNEFKHGVRDEAIITSMRPFLTKLGSALVVVVTSLTYIICNVTAYTNQISNLESLAEMGSITAAEKTAQIASIIGSVVSWQKTGLLLAMTVIPFITMFVSYIIYQKKYVLDEDYYDEICKELESRKK